MSHSFQVSLAPEKLWQAINPLTIMQQGGQFGFINIDLGQTAHPEIEQAVLKEVGSYGKQLGHIGDALEVLMKYVDRSKMTKPEQDTLTILEGELAEIRKVKERTRREGGPSA